MLNPVGVNCIRFFPREGIRVWGARTLRRRRERVALPQRPPPLQHDRGVDRGGTRWIVFEPNDRTLWKSIRRDIGAFLTRVWRDGALMGRTPAEAFFVKCDEETNPPEVIDAGHGRRGHRHRAGQAGRVRHLPHQPDAPAARRSTSEGGQGA